MNYLPEIVIGAQAVGAIVLLIGGAVKNNHATILAGLLATVVMFAVYAQMKLAGML